MKDIPFKLYEKVRIFRLVSSTVENSFLVKLTKDKHAQKLT